jgi:uncharacterized protein involved in response to NO
MEPYRLLFPLGVVYAVAGAALWAAGALGWMPYPAELHRMLMIEGFELSFVAGFLLTAIPGLTHSEKARPAEVAAGLGALALFGVLAVAGWTAWAHVAAAATIAVLATAALRRLARATPPTAATLPAPVEFVFIALGLCFGLAGTVLLAFEAGGQMLLVGPRFGDRLLSLGMVLSLVLGVGGLLVPTFSGMRDPLEIPLIARPHERGRRLWFYIPVVAALVAAFVLEWAGRAMAGAMVRALAGSAILLMVWKLPRGPGRRDLSAYAMWSAGILTLIGLWLLVLLPARPMAGLHVLFIGGYGLLTFAIGTRVVVAHGRHGLIAEPRVFGPLAAAFVAGALLLRLSAEYSSGLALILYGWAGAAWTLAWIAWAAGALPRIVRLNSIPTPHGPRPAHPPVTIGPPRDPRRT